VSYWHPLSQIGIEKIDLMKRVSLYRSCYLHFNDKSFRNHFKGMYDVSRFNICVQLSILFQLWNFFFQYLQLRWVILCSKAKHPISLSDYNMTCTFIMFFFSIFFKRKVIPQPLSRIPSTKTNFSFIPYHIFIVAAIAGEDMSFAAFGCDHATLVRPVIRAFVDIVDDDIRKDRDLVRHRLKRVIR